MPNAKNTQENLNENRFINREISWLSFNERVLQEAKDPSVPLIERLRFLGIFSNNLDEFYKVRYATVKRVALSEKSGRKVFGGQTAADLLKEITHITIELQKESIRVLEGIEKELEAENIYFINENEVLPEQEAFLRNYFLQTVSPALATIMLNGLKKFPHLIDTQSFLAVKIILKEHSRTPQYALIEIPTSISRFVVLPTTGDKQYLMMVDDLIRFHLSSIFSIFETESIEAHMIKISRDAELDFDDDLSKSYIEKVSESVKDRLDADPVRFVYDQSIAQDTLKFLLTKMGINDRTDSLIPGGRYHNRRDYRNFPSLGRADLLYAPVAPLMVKDFKLQGSLLSQISRRDFLVYTPYHTFSYITKFLRESALDPQVKNIYITIYRLSKLSNIASALTNAAKSGKNVVVQIELQARFDEKANIRYAEQLKAEGVQLIFGIRGLKVHSKICVVERYEQNKIKRYGFVSTGNFNESTAKVYTDYTLFTSNQSLLKEVKQVFQFLQVNYIQKKYKQLIISPFGTEKKFRKLIFNEIENFKKGQPAKIRIKLNNLTSYKMVEALYAASRAGVSVELIVRGICCLIPNVKGMSENIQVISVIDKFLEHPRLLIFENAGNPLVYISSADWMTRNLDNRVEVSCPVYDENIKNELIETFEMSWSDNQKSRLVNAPTPNAYLKNDKNPLRSQFALYEYYQNKLNEAT